ncbi:MAG TPA: segregation/condensation protein A [Byssovorax sp.]|jgi:segregation and condensation protein A
MSSRAAKRASQPPAAPGGEAERPTGEAAVVLDLPAAGFEGPLDLLLHLIQQHELDILDIPVGFVTEKFLAYLNLMRDMSIDVASEYLVMAATLAHIKSKMLLPTVPGGQDDDGLPGEDEEDPRAELVRRLLDYQKYKAAAAELGERSTLGKDVFPRGAPEPVPEGPAPFADVGVFSLLDAFERVLKKAKIHIDHEVVFDRITITDRIAQLADLLKNRRRVGFEELLLDVGGQARGVTRFDLVITFLAVLEMCKLHMIRVFQTDALSPIHVELSVQEPGGDEGFDRGDFDGEGVDA